MGGRGSNSGHERLWTFLLFKSLKFDCLLFQSYIFCALYMQCRVEGQALEEDRKVQTRIGSWQKGETFKTDKQKGFIHLGNINCVTVMMKIQLLIKSWSTKRKIILPPPSTFPHALGLNAVHYKNVTRGAVVFKGLK